MPQYDKADVERRMKGAVESFKGDLSGLRTGRANTTLARSGGRSRFMVRTCR